MKRYFVYILTNKYKSVLYIGVTNDLKRRLAEHCSGLIKGFTSKYRVHYLLYYEEFNDINIAIAREKELKGWIRVRKIELIKTLNPQLDFLNI